MRHRSSVAWFAAAAVALFCVQRIGADGALSAFGPAASAPAPAGARAGKPPPPAPLATEPREPVGASAATAPDVSAVPAARPPIARAMERDAAGGTPEPEPRIDLDPLEIEPGSRMARPTGFDPLGPRELLLWRLVEGRSAVMARGASAADGALEFPRVIVPRDGLEVVVAPSGRDPSARDASLPRGTAPAPPEPPQGEILAPEPGRWRLRVRPSGSVGEILLAGADGAIFARHALPPHTTPEAPILELIVELPAADTHIWLAHALPDGRRSEWRRAAPHRLEEVDPPETPEVP